MDVPGISRRRALETLEQVSQMVAGDLELKAVQASAMRAAAEALDAEACSILLKDAAANTLRFHFADGPQADGLAAACLPIDDRSIAGWVAGHGEPLLVPDAYADGRFNPAYDTQTGFRTRSLVCVPLVAKGKSLGVIQILNRRDGRPFGDEDLQLAHAVASLVAVAILNAEEHEARLQVDFDTIQTLATTLEAKDKYVHGHSERVRAWAVAIGRGLGLDAERLQTLSRGAELHDIGKLAIPDRILHARRRLTTEEWAIVREHPTRGVSLVRHLGFLRPTQPVILHHHERLDGSGYPKGLRGEDIPLEARIIAVVDAYDAMTSVRPYRRPLSHEAAAEELVRCSGVQFDPRCVQAFLKPGFPG